MAENKWATGFFFTPIQVDPGKVNMEPDNHLFEKEHHFPNRHFLGSSGELSKGCRFLGTAYPPYLEDHPS